MFDSLKYDSLKYRRMALENGYTQGLGHSYSRDDDNRYNLIILTTFVCLTYDISDDDCEGLATSHDGNSGAVYMYANVPADILMEIAVGPVEEIRKRLYEYDVNRSLEALG